MNQNLPRSSSAPEAGAKSPQATAQRPGTAHRNQEERLIALISPIIAPLGFEIVHIEVHNQRHKVLRIFIDRLLQPGEDSEKGIGIQDCVDVTKALGEPLDQLPEVEEVFKGPYELEVSSPGVDRPLRTERDYERFSGREVRIHTFRSLTAEEIQNASYQERNPKQKNFVGSLKGLVRSSSGEAAGVRLFIPKGDPKADSGKGAKLKKGQKRSLKKAAEAEAAGDEILIPLHLVSKANLEPHFDGL
jgi:ribosome maturation factor RimP